MATKKAAPSAPGRTHDYKAHFSRVRVRFDQVTAVCGRWRAQADAQRRAEIQDSAAKAIAKQRKLQEEIKCVRAVWPR